MAHFVAVLIEAAGIPRPAAFPTAALIWANTAFAELFFPDAGVVEAPLIVVAAGVIGVGAADLGGIIAAEQPLVAGIGTVEALAAAAFSGAATRGRRAVWIATDVAVVSAVVFARAAVAIDTKPSAVTTCRAVGLRPTRRARSTLTREGLAVIGAGTRRITTDPIHAEGGGALTAVRAGLALRLQAGALLTDATRADHPAAATVSCVGVEGDATVVTALEAGITADATPRTVARGGTAFASHTTGGVVLAALAIRAALAARSFAAPSRVGLTQTDRPGKCAGQSSGHTAQETTPGGAGREGPGDFVESLAVQGCPSRHQRRRQRSR